MVTESTAYLAREQQLDELIAAYLDQLEAGEAPTPDEWLNRHPEFKSELTAFFTDRNQLERLAAPLRAITHPLVSVDSPGRLGDFRILREIGRGGMGVVYEAEQISLNRRVALKVLPFASMLDRQQLARFKNEARAAATLDHPNIVSVYSVGVERGVHYYAMQLIEGNSLAECIAEMRGGTPSPRPLTQGEGPGRGGSRDSRVDVANVDTAPIAHLSTLPDFNSKDYFRSVANLGIQAAEALDHAHQNGILHRDIKPANLMVDDAGKLWITDFGLARIEQDAGMTMTGDILGTLRYMSPEQALAKRAIVDHRSDIYSLGVTLYELLTLQSAYPAVDRQELLRQIAFEEPVNPRRHDAHVPRDLETIVLRAIEKNPADRFGTAHELVEDLRRFLNDQPIKATPASYLHQVIKWSRRHRSGVTAAGIVTILLMMVATALVADRWRQVREGTQFVRDSLRAARAALAANDVEQASKRSAEAQTRIDAHRLTDLDLVHDVTELVRESDRYAQFELLLPKARNQRSAEQSTVSADEAIKLYCVMDSPDWLGSLRKAGLPETHINRVGDAVYELLLLKADHLTRWGEHRSSENTRQAVKYLDRAKSFHAPSRGYYWLRANCSHFRGDREREAQLRQTALDTPVHHAAELFYINRDRRWGAVSTKQGYPTEASYKDHREMLRFDPAYYNGLFFMALGFSNEGRHAESLVAWYGCLAMNPGDQVALHNRGASFLALGHYEEAIADFREAIRLTKSNHPLRFYVGLGTALDENGNYDEAIIAYQRAIEIKPDDAAAHGNLGNTLSRLGRSEEAISEYREAIRLEPDSEAAFNSHVGLAIVFQAQGKLDDSIAESREAARQKPDDSLAHARLGSLLKSKGLIDEAIYQLREAIRLDPDEAAAHGELGSALESKGLIDEAIAEHRETAAAYRKLLRQQPDDPLAQADLAWLLTTSLDSSLHDPQEALELAEKAVQREPLNHDVWLALGIARYRLGHWQDALDALRKSAELPFGGGSNAWFFLAMVEWQLDHHDAAHQWHAKAVEWQEKNRPADAELIRFRNEAQELLGVREPRDSAGKSKTTETPED